jgi:parvulin-like peptidyl-prolyl isomerase
VVAVVAEHGMQKEDLAEQVEAVMAEVRVLQFAEVIAQVIQPHEQEMLAQQIQVAVVVEVVTLIILMMPVTVVQELQSFLM